MREAKKDCTIDNRLHAQLLTARLQTLSNIDPFYCHNILEGDVYPSSLIRNEKAEEYKRKI